MELKLCVEIRPDQEVEVKKPRKRKRPECTEETCTTPARSGYDRCSRHGGGGKRCAEETCNTPARSGYDRCKKHGGGPRCAEETCTTPAESGYDRCKRHGGGKRCADETCNTSALDGYDRCKHHGGGAICAEQDCNTSASSGYDRCVKHGGGPRCPNCIDWIDSRVGNTKYDGWCATCFKDTFPNDPRSKISSTSRELLVRRRINEEFDDFTHDRTMYTGHCDCTHRRRIDHRKIINNTMIAVETDEFAHRGYDKEDEIVRYDDLYMIFSGKWIYIRFNPDDNRSKVDFEDKLETLIDTIHDCIDKIENEENDELVEILKLFY